ncbi:MAG: hypothetical protein WCT99_03295 [Bacteroidota bacterium]|jgi:hypothetical protein
MKKIFFTLLSLLVCDAQVFAQNNRALQITNRNIVGIWQLESSKEASGWGTTYRFYSDGRFIFQESQMMAYYINPIINFGGRYNVKGDSLFTRVEYYHEKTNAKIIRGDELSGEWELSGGKIIKNVQLSVEESAKLENISLKDGIMTFSIYGNKYYKVSNSPEGYDK